MGEEIQYSHFRKSDYDQFTKFLQRETRLLGEYFSENALSNHALVAGYELEAWLIDERSAPCPHNELFLQQANNELLTPELARFNVELNVNPQNLSTTVLSDFATSLQNLWDHCESTAQLSDCHILGIGILPTLEDRHLHLNNLSTMERYRALNEQVLRQRKGESILLNIVGKQHLESEHMGMM